MILCRLLLSVKSRALATFVHGKKCGIEKLADSVMADFISDASKALVLRSIKDMATKERGVGGIGSIRWVVKPDILTELKMEVSFFSLWFSINLLILIY